MTTAICFENVTKCYRLGSGAGSLRDALAGWASGRGRRERSQLTRNGIVNAVQDLSFRVEQGESLGIIGRNGAGKTTVLRMLSGITRPTSGYIARRGRVSALIELGAGFHPDLTGRENIYLNGSILGLKRREIDRLFDDIVAFAELERFIDTPVKRYSSGMYVRLGFAVAAHTRPDILLVDEVLSVGDQAFQAKCLNRIGEMQREGMTAVIVSHNMVLIRRHCRRALLLEAGHKTAEGDPGQVIQLFEKRLSDMASQAISQERCKERVGVTNRIRIRRLTFTDHLGREVSTVHSGQPFCIQIHYEASTSVVDPVFEVVLRSMVLGGILARFDNRVYGVNLGRIAPGYGKVEVCLDGVQLKTDRLDVSVSVFSSDYSELFEWVEGIGSVFVHSDFVGEGLVDIRATWIHANG